MQCTPHTYYIEDLFVIHSFARKYEDFSPRDARLAGFVLSRPPRRIPQETHQRTHRLQPGTEKRE